MRPGDRVLEPPQGAEGITGYTAQEVIRQSWVAERFSKSFGKTKAHSSAHQ